MTNRILVASIGIVAGIATIVGSINTLLGNASGFCSVLWWLGLFTWDDAMVLGMFVAATCIVLWFKNESVLTGLFFSSYAFFRSLIEVFYNLNAQFSPITRPWESQLPHIASIFNLQLVELFVIGQIFFTSICIISFLLLLSYIKKYFRLPV